MANPKLMAAYGPESNASYQADSDVRILAEAARIQADPKRMAAAKKAAKRKLDELEAEEEHYEDIAGIKPADEKDDKANDKD
jgi:hypothetical protein